MPLITVTGLPSSGKSKTSQEILNYFQEKLKHDDPSCLVRIVSDNDKLDWSGRDSIYMNAGEEKELRAWLMAETQRYVNLNQIVILDAAAYIKGFRYELFCIAKEARTQFSVVEKLLDPDTCWKLNEERLQVYRNKGDINPEEPEPGYKRETFDALVNRYEECVEDDRWDSPLYRMTSTIDRLNLDNLYERITQGEPLKPNRATILIHSSKPKYRT